MKIAFQTNPDWDNKPNAEAELAKRMLIAARSIGLQAISSSNHSEIERFAPDVLLPLHFFIPKLFDAFTIGCMWNPTYAIDHNKAWDNIKSYDGFAVSSLGQEQFVRALKFKSPNPYLVTKLLPSTNATSYQPITEFHNPVYIGSNWSKNRHKGIFPLLKNIDIYGPKESWSGYAKHVYKGEVAFDGSSVLEKYRNAGIGLSLHHDAHNLEGLPSMRPFEIAASGAVLISDLNPFVIQEFGDNALYLDTQENPEFVNELLEDLIQWVQNNKKSAQEMAFACHQIFIKRFSLEVLLNNLIEDFKSFKENQVRHETPQVDIVVRSDGEDRDKLMRALRSIEMQTYPTVRALIIFRGEKHALGDLRESIAKSGNKIPILILQFNEQTDRGTQFFFGLRASTAPIVGFLDHDDILFSDHIDVLVNTLLNNPDASLAYSGSVQVWEGGSPPIGEVQRRLAYFCSMNNREKLKPCITSNSYLVWRSKIPWSLLNQPIPKISAKEDYLFLKILYEYSPRFLFSEKITCAFYWRITKNENSAFDTEVWQSGRIVCNTITRESYSKIDYVQNTKKSLAVSMREILIKFMTMVTNIHKKSY